MWPQREGTLDVAEFRKMSELELLVVMAIYADLQGFCARFNDPLGDVSVQQVLTATVLMQIGQASMAGMTNKAIAEQFGKIGKSIIDGDYNDFIEQTRLVNTQPPTDTVQ